jgi:hypothetical protein
MPELSDQSAQNLEEDWSMRTLAALAGALALALGAAAADEANKAAPAAKSTDAPKPRPKPTLPEGTPAEQVKTLIQQYDEAAADFSQRYKTAVSEAEQEKLFEQYFPVPDDYAALLVRIAEKHPKDSAALDALLWAARHASRPRNQPDSPFARARKALVRDHLDSPQIGPFCLALRYESEDPTTPDLLRHVWTKNPDKRAQAQAGFALAKLLRRRASWPRSFQEMTAEQVASFEKAYGKEAVAALRRVDADAETKEAEAVLERLTQDQDYAAALVDRGNNKVAVGDLARRELFEIRRLQPGQPAPETVGADIDGRPFKLSDYRGKVVLLDFWGHW